MANEGLFPPEYSSPVGQVRLLIGDVDSSDAPGSDAEFTYFSDSEIQGYLTIYPNIKRAAARALDTIADSQALLMKKIRTDDLQTDGAAVANALRVSAKNLRQEADAADEASGESDDIRFDDMPAYRYGYYGQAVDVEGAPNMIGTYPGSSVPWGP